MRGGRLAALSTYFTSTDAFPPWKHPTRPGGSGALGSGQTMPGDRISAESQAHGIHTQPSLPPMTPVAPTLLSLAGPLPITSDLYIWLPHTPPLSVCWALPTGHGQSQPLICPQTCISHHLHPFSCSGQKLVIILEHQGILTLPPKDHIQNLPISPSPLAPPCKNL